MPSSFVLDDCIRGVPPASGTVGLEEVGALGWRPADNSMPLPVLTLDEAAFARNCDQMFAYARANGVALAPHAKTPMSPEIVRSLLRRGAWGATTANLQQTAVLLRAGCTRLLLANQIGGEASGRRLGELLKSYPDAEVSVFADTPDAVKAIAAAARHAGRSILVLVEVGAGRAGARNLAAVQDVIASIAASDGLVLAGVAAYEGAAAGPDPDQTKKAIAALTELAAHAFKLVRERAPDRHLILSAGGSAFFDLVVSSLRPTVAADGNATLILRSGAIFFHDHGVYERALRALDERGGFLIDGEVRSAAAAFTPALRLWAEVLSRPEPGLAICGMGMRDVSSDQDLPVPLCVYRDGRPLPLRWSEDQLRVRKLNDQHAFLEIPPDSGIAVGDVVEFGISHPCTCLDRWRVFFGLAEDGRVRSAYRTFFG